MRSRSNPSTTRSSRRPFKSLFATVFSEPRIMTPSRSAPDHAQKARPTCAWQRWEQATETLDMAEEAEDFQAVGMKCRECLIQLVRFLAKSEMFPPGEDAPQRSNFISLSALNQSS